MNRQTHTEQLEALLQISYFVDSVMELRDILRKICEITLEAQNADACSIYLCDKGCDRLRLRASKGLSEELVDRSAYAKGAGIPGWVFETKELLALSDAPSDPRYQILEGLEHDEFKAWICAPLLIRNEALGVMSLRYRDNRCFDAAEIVMFETVSRQVGIVVDKSRMYFQKLEAERMAAIGLSLSEISHSIKNILGNLKGATYLVDHGLGNDKIDMARQAWPLVKNVNERISRLVQNMLGYSRTGNLVLESGDINAIARMVMDSSRVGPKAKNLEIRDELAAELPQISFDSDHIYDCLLNLVSNAVDALDGWEGGVVRVASRRDGDDYVVLTVADNGPGIPEEARDKIFQLFFTTKGSEGSGIGLASTRKVIEQHGGMINFQTADGEGTTFTIRLPVMPPTTGGEG